MRISDWSSDVCSSDLQALQLDLHLLAQLEVERRERLVEQQHLGLAGERARQRHALLLSAGELSRPAVGVALQLHQRQHPLDARGALRSEARRVGKEWVSTCTSRRSPYNDKNKIIHLSSKSISFSYDLTIRLTIL